MSTLAENVAKVTAAHAALKTAIAAKGVAVPDGTKLSDMPALVDEIQAMPATSRRAVFAYDQSASIVVQNKFVVDLTTEESLAGLFSNCSNLTSFTLPDGLGQSATNLDACFISCSSLTSLTLPSGFGQNATALHRCFYGCSNLTSLTLPAGFGSNATDLTYCFSYCSALTSLTLPDGFGQNAARLDSCFRVCTSLTTITGNPNFRAQLSLSDSTKLTHDSLMVVINGLQTVTTAKTLTLGSTNLAKLTDAEKKVATDKGWTLA